MDFLLRNRFVQSLGVGTFFFLLLKAGDWALILILRIVESFSRWYRYTASPHAFRVAIVVSIIYLLLSAAFSSRQNP